MVQARNLLIGMALCGLWVAGCGGHRPTTYVSATQGAATPQSSSSTGPVSSSSGGSSSPAPVSSGSQPAPSPAPSRSPVGDVSLTFAGPGPERVDADALGVTALALRLSNHAPVDLTLRALEVRATGSLDDAAAIATCRLAEDTDGDGRFDPQVDATLASAGFPQDDGVARFTPPLQLPAGSSRTLLVALDLNGAGRAQDTLRLVVEPAGLVAEDAQGAPATARFRAFAGPLLRLGGWVPAQEAFGVPGEGLRPRVARDAQGRTHVGLFQNLNFNSDVFYTVFDGRSWSTPDGVSRSSHTAWDHDLAVDAGGLPWLVWEEWDQGPGDVGVRVSQFDPQAFAWTPSERISPGHGDMNLDPRVVIAPTQPPTVHVVWEHWAGGSSPRLQYRRHDAQGWSQIAEVSSLSLSAPGEASDPSLTLLPSGEVLIAWAENDPVRSEVRARRVDAQGVFSPVEVVAQSANQVRRTEVLADGADVQLVYEENGVIRHQRRDAQGRWSRPADVSRHPARGASAPALALHQGVLQVIWVEDAMQVYTAHAQGGGFSVPVALTDDAFFRDTPVLVSEGDRLRAIWQDRRLGRQRVFTSWREDSTLEAPLQVAAPGGDPGRPAACEDALGQVHVAWSVDAGGNGEVFVARQDAQGFGAAENVSRSASGSYRPALAAAGDTLWAAWEEDAPGGFQVRAAARTASGWATPAVVSSASPAYAPALAGRPDGTADLVWTAEAAPGDYDLRIAHHDGQRWSAPRPLAPRAGSNAWNPDLALAADGSLAVTWEEEGARREVYVAVIPPSGGAQVAAVASTTSGQYAPRVAWEGQDLHVVWAEDGHVRAAVRRAGQARFEPPSDLTQGGSWAPDVAVAGGLVSVSWEQWQGQDARVLQALRTPQGWSAPVALDMSRGPSRRVTALGTLRGGVRVFWSEPGRLVERERRSR